MVSDLDSGPPLRLRRVLLALWRLSRPEIWLVTLLPFYLGYVLASQQVLPGFGLWTRFWAEAADEGATFGAFWSTLEEWALVSWRFLLGALVMGPLVWWATLLINDVHDLEGDRLNPRRVRSPLVLGWVSVGFAHKAAYLFAGLCLLSGLLVGPVFALLVLVALVLAWLYSVPPVRLKTRPGFDLAVNAVGIGFGAALAGWSVAAPLAGFPWVLAPQGLLVAVAAYAPTTIVDAEVDRRVGASTMAVRFGEQAAYRVGWWAWVLANLGAVLLAASDLVLPRRFLPVLVLFVPVLLFEYHTLIGKARSQERLVEGIVVTSLTFAAVNAVFMLMYTGLWV